MIVYLLDAAARRWPPGFVFRRGSPALRDLGGRWEAVPAHEPLWEPAGLRVGGARPVDLALPDLGPYSPWDGTAGLLYRQYPSAVGLPEELRWELADIGDEADTGLRLAAPGDGNEPRVLSAILERTAGDGAELAVRQAGAWAAVVNSGDPALGLGSGWSLVRQRGVGPNGGLLEELALAWPRADGQEIWLLPAGRAPAAGAVIVHHLQCDAGTAWGGYAPAVGVLAEDRAEMALDPEALAGTLELDAVAPLDAPGRHVLWQRDDGTEQSRLSLALQDGRLILDAVSAGLPSGSTDLGALAPGAAVSLALDLAASPITAARDGAAPVPLTLAATPAAAVERLGSAAVEGAPWQGWIARALMTR